jgi:hypothetical protein
MFLFVGSVRRHFSVFAAQSKVGVSAFYTRFCAPGKGCLSLACERRLRRRRKAAPKAQREGKNKKGNEYSVLAIA